MLNQVDNLLPVFGPKRLAINSNVDIIEVGESPLQGGKNPPQITLFQGQPSNLRDGFPNAFAGYNGFGRPQDCLPEEHLARFVADVTDQMEVGCLRGRLVLKMALDSKVASERDKVVSVAITSNFLIMRYVYGASPE
jgi:hypothetical protein